MSRISKWSLLLGLILLASGCVSAKKLATVRAIPVGMKELQVGAIVGQPSLKDRTEDGMERWLWVRRTPYGTESAFLIFREGRVVSRGSEEAREGQVWKEVPAEPSLETNALVTLTNIVVLPVAAVPEFKHEKSSDQIRREQDEALADAQREARRLEETARPLDENARAAEEKAPSVASRLEAPPWTAWYMAQQLVRKQLAPRRTLFPNPRFANDLAGEERGDGNVWRTWGYVDTSDSANTPKRLHWTAQLEFKGGTKWDLKDLAFADSAPVRSK